MNRPVLWVEDNPDQRLLMEIAARSTAFAGSYDVAETYGEGIEAIRTRAAWGQPYRLLLCDLQLPGGDGWSLLSTVTDEDLLPAEVVIISASSDVRDRVRATDAGLAFETKPNRIDGWTDLAERMAALAGLG